VQTFCSLWGGGEKKGLGNGSLATGYVGQSSWTTVNLTGGPDFLFYPAGVVTGADGTLLVAGGQRYGNYPPSPIRVLTQSSFRMIFKYSPPIVSGALPDGFIGPPYVNFTGPTYLRFDGAGNLYASDTRAYRVVCVFSFMYICA
jgi:hypothetical protein